MKWNEIREAFPHQWLIIEAIEAHSENGHRIFDQISVVEAFPKAENSDPVMRCYGELQANHREREFLFIHTDREEIVIQERVRHNVPTKAKIE
jgi:hypothetical protein